MSRYESVTPSPFIDLHLLAIMVCVLLGGGLTPAQAQEHVTMLTASDAADFDNFGFVLDYDQDRLIVGAPGYNGAANNEGRAYIFRRENGMWMEEALLRASDPEFGGEFGDAVVLQGSFAYVGSNRRNNSQGGIYVFEWVDGTWTERSLLLPSDTQESHVFSNDFDIDGDRMLVGAYGDNDFAGAAYIFEQDAPGQWREVAKLTASDPMDRAFFGINVALEGDRALIGANGHTELMGAAYVFERNALGEWHEVAQLTASDGVSEDRFGFPVALQGEYAYVTSRADAGADNSGAVYIFRQDGADWNQVAQFTSPNPIADGRFGRTLLAEGTLLLIGTREESTIYRYQRVAATTWQERASIPVGEQGSDLGQSLVLHENELFVGESGFQTAQGAIHVFDMTSVLTATEEPAPAPLLADVEVYPNPFRQNACLVFDLPEPARVHVKIFDVLGREVYQSPEQALNAGKAHSLPLDLSPLPAGGYLYQVKVDATRSSAQYTGHFVMVR
jgi:hypothetical protein